MLEVFNVGELKKIGMIQQKQKEYFVLRLRAVAGDLNATQLRRIAEISEKYGQGWVHLSTRQGVEIHHVHQSHLEKSRKELEEVDIQMGACGPRVRVVVCCPGNDTCGWGIIETKEIARYLDARYFRSDTPHKFKMGVTGCPHNCAKSTENDIGVMGGILPAWFREECIYCNMCLNVCPADAIYKENDEFLHNQDKCINCSICTSSCPTSAWKPIKRGFNLTIGGTMGKNQRIGSMLKKLIENKEELYNLIENAIDYYRKHGRKRERFGIMIDRIGLEKVKEEILLGMAKDQPEYVI